MSDAWQPIETAPRDGTRILVWPAWGVTTQGTRVEVVRWREGKRSRGWEGLAGYLIPTQPTHWMIPKPPEDARDD